MNRNQLGVVRIDFEDFEQRFKYVRKWMDAMVADESGSEGTRNGYLRDLMKYCEWIKKDPDRLIEERMSDITSGDPTKMDGAESELKSYTAMLRRSKNPKSGKPYAKNTVKRRVAAVRSFYKKAFPHGKLVSKLPSGSKKSKTRTIRNDTVRKLCAHATPQQRGAILTIFQGFFRPVTLAAIPARRFLDAIERWKTLRNGEGPVHISVEEDENKGDECSYDTFISEDAVEAISALGDVDPEKPLFSSEKNISKLIREAARSAGLKGRVNARVLRASGTTILSNAHVPDPHIEIMQGHYLKYGGAYRDPTVDELRESYMMADLSVYGAVGVKTKIEDLNQVKKEFAKVIYEMCVAAEQNGMPQMLQAIKAYAGSNMDFEWDGNGIVPLPMVFDEIVNHN